MDRHRLWFAVLKGSGLSLMAVLSLGLALFLRGSWCWNCRGNGVRAESGVESACPDCLGSGWGSHFYLRVYRNAWSERPCVALVRGGRDLWEVDLHAMRSRGWHGAGIAVAIGLVVGLRGGACPLCARQGRIVLEVESPGKQPDRRSVECPACEGRGSLTRLDRWLAGV